MNKKRSASTVMASMAGAMMALGLLAWPTAEASASDPNPAPRKPAISQPGLQSSLARQRAETLRTAASRAAARAREQSTGDSAKATGTSVTR